MKHFEIVRWSDESIGIGFELYWNGQYAGTAGSIRQLRSWAREIWQFGFV